VANALQHAQATRINVRLTFERDNLLMEIADDGQGFDVAGAPVAEQGHFGIAGMKERAANIKADFAIQSDNVGTRITLKVPIPLRRGQFWRRVFGWRRPFPTAIHSRALYRNTRG